jgi:aryl-alcohol dehydrogenase-like predicted oxidoreductase
MGIGGAYGISGDASVKAFERGLNYFFWMPAWEGLTDGLRRLVRTHRQDIVISAGVAAADRNLAGVQKTLRDALEILGTDYVDILQVPLGTPGELDMALTPGGMLEWMREMRDKGSVRALGSSTHNRALARHMAETGALDMVMVRYNCAHRGVETEVLPATRAAGIGVVAFTVLRWGTLLQRPDPSQEGWPANRPIPSAVDCYRYVLNNRDVHLTLTGARTWEQLEGNLQAADEGQPPLTSEELAWLREFGDVVYKTPVRAQPAPPQSS